MKLKQISFNVRPDMYETLQKLQAKTQSFDMSETLRKCIQLAKAEYIDKYTAVAQDKMNKPKLDPKEKVRHELEVKEERAALKKQLFLDGRRKVAEILGATITETAPGSGIFACTYNKYSQRNNSKSKELSEMPITMPLEQLPDDAPEYQYYDYMGRHGLDIKEKLLALINEPDGQEQN